MQAAVKNMRKNLAVSEESAIFVMPNIQTDTPLLLLFYSGSLCGNGVNLLDVWRHLQRGYRFLCIHITKLLSTLCQTSTKAVQQRIIVPALHPYLSGKRFHSKKSTNLFAEFETLHTFVSANILKSISDTVIYFIAKTRSAVSVSVQCVCQNIKGLRFLCVHTLTNFCSEQWQTRTRVSTRRTVTSLQPYLNGKLCTAATSRKRSFPNLPNFIKSLSTANTGTHPSPAAYALKSPTSTRSIIRTWLSVGLSLPLWKRRRSPESTASASASRSKKNRKLVRKTNIKTGIKFNK